MAYTPGYGNEVALALPAASPLPGASAEWNAYRDALRQAAIRNYTESLDSALRGVERHYASRGLSSSGLREGSIGETARQNANALGNALVGVDSNVLSWILQQNEREKAYQREQQRLLDERAWQKSQVDDWRKYQEAMTQKQQDLAQQRYEEQQRQQALQYGAMADRMAIQAALGGGDSGFGGGGGYGPGGLEQAGADFASFFEPQNREAAQKAAYWDAFNRSGLGRAGAGGGDRVGPFSPNPWDATWRSAVGLPPDMGLGYPGNRSSIQESDFLW